MEIKEISKETVIAGITSAILAGGLLWGGMEIHNQEIKEARIDLLSQVEFTRNNPDLCRGKNPDERCLTDKEFKLLTREYTAVKNVNIEKKASTLEEKLNDKLLK